jgi:hypothetical protein
MAITPRPPIITTAIINDLSEEHFAAYAPCIQQRRSGCFPVDRGRRILANAL